MYVFDVKLTYPQERAKKALNKTGWSGVESAMEWLLSHPEGEDEEEEDEEMQAEPEVPKGRLISKCTFGVS